MTTAIYAGSFDPITKGHLDIVKRAADIMDRVVVGVFDSPEKSLTFSTPERVGLCEKSIHDMNIMNVEIMAYGGLTVEFARKVGASVMIRGLRSITDLDHEASMVMMNRKLRPDIDTMFLYTSLEYQFVSSTLIKEVARYGGDIEDLVPHHVAVAIRDNLNATV